MRQLARAEYTVADAYLAGRIDRAEATRLLMRYILFSEARAAQRVRFIDVNRSYVINYGLGRDVVQAWVERQGLTGGRAWRPCWRARSCRWIWWSEWLVASG